MPLSDVQCRNAVPRPKIYKLTDGDGLYLEVRPGGSRYWRLKYHYLGKENRISLGVYPVTSLAKARMLRDEVKDKLINGINPSEERKHHKRMARYQAAQTFEEVAREWHENYKSNWTARHANNILQRLKNDAFPVIGSCPVSKLTASTILACIQKIEDRKRYDLARRVKQTIGQVMRYAVVTDRAARDMTPDLKGALKRYKKGHYAAIEVEELPDLVKAIYNNETRVFYQTAYAIKLMLLTFQRTNELLQAKWQEFDLEKAMWSIPAERMKMDRPHLVPLSRQVIEILLKLKEKGGKSEYILPSPIRWKNPVSEVTILTGLKRLGYGGKMTGHGFRALAMSTIKEKLGYEHDIVDRQLAHLPKSKVDQAYDRAKYIPQRTKMMQEWADYIDTLK